MENATLLEKPKTSKNTFNTTKAPFISPTIIAKEETPQAVQTEAIVSPTAEPKKTSYNFGGPIYNPKPVDPIKSEESAIPKESTAPIEETKKAPLFSGSIQDSYSKKTENTQTKKETASIDLQKADISKNSDTKNNKEQPQPQDGKEQSSDPQSVSETSTETVAPMVAASTSVSNSNVVVLPAEAAQKDTAVVAEPEAVVRTTPADAKSDPNFNETISKVKKAAKGERAHVTKTQAEKNANEAATIPGGERKSKARGNQVSKMDEQKTGEFRAIDFRAKLKSRINQMQLPKTEEQADNFEDNNNINQVNNAASGDVVTAKNSVTGGLENTTKQEPNEALIPQRTATALPDPKIGSKDIIKTTKAVPPKRGIAEVNTPLEKKYETVEQEMQQNQVTDEQLSKSNEPTFNAALDAKNTARQHTQTGPEKFRAAENSQLTTAKTEAQTKADVNLEGMHSSRKTLLGGVTDKQQNAGTKNTAKHQAAVTQLNQIYTETKTAVETQLSTLETAVTTLFDMGARAAKAAFENHVAQKMAAYKKKRYDNVTAKYGYVATGAVWLFDKAAGLPKEVEAFFVSGRIVFITTLDSYIATIATIVAARLNSAKSKIVSGRQKIASYIKDLPNDIKKSIKGDIDAIQGKFNALEESVNQKESDLIDSLAAKYNEAVTAVDAQIEQLKMENEGWLGAAKRALAAVIEVINNIRKMLTELISAAADVIVAIITDPIGFLSNLFSGIAEGFTNFGTNIATHLQTGLMGWLTGAMGGLALKMPEDIFSLKGIFSLASQLLGFTWEKVRMVGAKVIGEPVVQALETSSKLVVILRTEGISGLWDYIKEQFTDLKETVMDSVQDLIQNQVIQAGIKWIMGLLTPAGAFIKAAMAIIEVVKFFVQRASQIMELVQAFIESIRAVASGSVKAVASSIENALVKAIPVLIGFLASLFGLSGLADKVIGIFKKIHQRVENGLKKLWEKIKALGGSLLKKIGVGKSKQENDPEKQKKLDAGFIYLQEQEQKEDADRNNKLTLEQAQDAAQKTKAKHSVFSSLKAIATDDKIIYKYTASPEETHESSKGVENGKAVKGQLLNNNSINDKNELYITENRAGQELLGYKAKTKESPETFDGFIVGREENAYIRTRREKGDFNDQFGKLNSKDITERRKIIQAGIKHTNYKPDKVEITAVGNQKIELAYKYSKAAHEGGQQDYSVLLELSDITKNEVTQRVVGNNLALKIPGTRGYNDSAGDLAKKDYGIDLNAAHALADRFMGSGYKSALNLILTSKEFNQETMGNAEDEIAFKIKQKMLDNPNKFVTFDMTVIATFEVLKDDPILAELKKLHPDMDQETKEATLMVLQGKQDPRRCIEVLYKAKTYGENKEELGIVDSSTEKEDTWLDNLFEINK